MANFKEEDFYYDDLNEIKTFLELWKERFPDSWINTENMIVPSEGIKPKQIFRYSPSNLPSEMFSFKNWNDIKIEHYDCDDADFVFFRCLAKYLEGNVVFVNRDDINKLQITISFRGGKAYFERGRMEYKQNLITPRTMKYKNRDRFKEIEAIVQMVKEKNGGKR